MKNGEKKDPIIFLNKNRFDIIAKYLYAKSVLESTTASNWIESIYKEHIRSINDFVEKNNNKNSYKNFKESFLILISSFKENGFDDSKESIPISIDGVAQNGAHRIGAAIALKKKVRVKYIEKNSISYDYKYFKDRGFSEKYLDYMALQYCKIKKDYFIAMLFPVIGDKASYINSLLEESGDVFFKKDIFLNRNGLHNLVLQMYRDQDWTSIEENSGYSKTLEHSFNRYEKNKPVSILFIENTNLSKLKEIKLKIRELLKKGNYPIHIPDNIEESIRISEQVLNENSINFLNTSRPKNNKNFVYFLKKFNQYINESTNSKDSYCISGSSVMSAYGLRDTRDLDVIAIKKLYFNDKDIHLHNKEVEKYLGPCEEIVKNPENHFYYNGIKFMTIDLVYKLKNKRNEHKDKIDTAIISSIINKKSLVNKIYNKAKGFFYTLLGYLINFMKRKTPKIIRPMVLYIYRIFKQK
jgi:hypothetical protein